MRVVFDTNIIISAIIFPGGKAEEALLRITESRDELLISKSIIIETLRVLASKYSKDREELARVALFLSDIAILTNPDHKTNIFDDEPDNRILECAFTGLAECIVTGDKAMLQLKEYSGIPILGLTDYLSSC